MNDEEIIMELNLHRTDKSNKVLLIFENEKIKKIFKQKYKLTRDEDEQYVLLSLEHLHTSRNALVGKHFRKYVFMED